MSSSSLSFVPGGQKENHVSDTKELVLKAGYSAFN